MSPELAQLRRLACEAPHAPAHTHRGWSQSEDAVGGFRSLLRLCIIKRPHTHSDTPRTPGTEGAHPGPKQRPAPTARPRVRLAALVPQQDSRAAARFSRRPVATLFFAAVGPQLSPGHARQEGMRETPGSCVWGTGGTPSRWFDSRQGLNCKWAVYYIQIRT